MRLRRSGRGQAPAYARDRMYSPIPHATAPPLLPTDDTERQLPDQLGDAISVDKQLGEVVIEDDREIPRSGVKLIRQFSGIDSHRPPQFCLTLTHDLRFNSRRGL